jgi:hypothetical protein
MNLPNWIKLQGKASGATKVMLQGLRIPGIVPHMRYDVLSKDLTSATLPSICA